MSQREVTYEVVDAETRSDPDAVLGGPFTLDELMAWLPSFLRGYEGAVIIQVVEE